MRNAAILLPGLVRLHPQGIVALVVEAAKVVVQAVSWVEHHSSVIVSVLVALRIMLAVGRVSILRERTESEMTCVCTHIDMRRL